MKGHKSHHHRKHRANGGETGVREYEEDMKDHPRRYNSSKVEDEAEERNAGGRVARRHGGKVHSFHHLKARSEGVHVGHVKGNAAKLHAGKKARKAGGRAGSDTRPLSSAHAGTMPKGHKAYDIN